MGFFDHLSKSKGGYIFFSHSHLETNNQELRTNNKGVPPARIWNIYPFKHLFVAIVNPLPEPTPSPFTILHSP